MEEFVKQLDYLFLCQVGKNCFKVKKNGKNYFLKVYPRIQYNNEFVFDLRNTIEIFSNELQNPKISPIHVIEHKEYSIHVFKNIAPAVLSTIYRVNTDYNYKFGNFLSKLHEIGQNLPNKVGYYQHKIRTNESVREEIFKIYSEIELISDIKIKHRLTNKFEERLLLAENLSSNLVSESETVNKIVLHGDFLPKNILSDNNFHNFYPIDWDCVAYGPKFHEIIRYFEKEEIMDNEKLIHSFLSGYFDGSKSKLTWEEIIDSSQRYLINKVYNIYEYPEIKNENIEQWLLVAENINSLIKRYNKFIEYTENFYKTRCT